MGFDQFWQMDTSARPVMNEDGSYGASAEEKAIATKIVKAYANDEADEAMLLDMLGIADEVTEGETNE